MRLGAVIVALWFVSPGILLGDWVPPASIQPSGLRSSPDGETAVVWFDADVGKPFGLIRTILVTPIPRGDPLFSLATFPRHTLVEWNSQSNRCLIIDAPDNGNVNFWLLERRKKEDWKAVRINPMASLEETFVSDPAWDGHHLWRPGVESASWLDDKTVRIKAVDNKGEYEITLPVDNLSHPRIKKLASGTP